MQEMYRIRWKKNALIGVGFLTGLAVIAAIGWIILPYACSYGLILPTKENYFRICVFTIAVPPFLLVQQEYKWFAVGLMAGLSIAIPIMGIFLLRIELT